MDLKSSTSNTAPERRAKSWKREHEERCSRRLDQKKKGTHKSKDVSTGVSVVPPSASTPKEEVECADMRRNSSAVGTVGQPVTDCSSSVKVERGKYVKPYTDRSYNGRNKESARSSVVTSVGQSMYKDRVPNHSTAVVVNRVCAVEDKGECLSKSDNARPERKKLNNDVQKLSREMSNVKLDVECEEGTGLKTLDRKRGTREEARATSMSVTAVPLLSSVNNKLPVSDKLLSVSEKLTDDGLNITSENAQSGTEINWNKEVSLGGAGTSSKDQSHDINSTKTKCEDEGRSSLNVSSDSRKGPKRTESCESMFAYLRSKTAEERQNELFNSSSSSLSCDGSSCSLDESPVLAIEKAEGELDKKVALKTYVEELEKRLATSTELRVSNQNVASLRPDESYFSRLDSSLKKNTAFVRKLKHFTASQLDALLKDLSSLNLTKYVSEAASALVEAKLKMTDIPNVIKLCNVLHQTYSEFSTYLLDNWQRFLTIRKDDKSINQSKLRVDLKFYAELINVGILTYKEGLPLLGNVLTVLINMDKEEHNNVNIILTFCRHCGEDYAGLVPRKMRLLAEEFRITIPRSKLLSREKQRNVRTLLKEYYSSLCKHLTKEHYDLQSFERQNRKILQTKGELSSERKEKWEALQLSFQRLQTAVTSFSEVLDEDVPPLPRDELDTEESDLKVGNSESEDGTVLSNLWEDEDSQHFYEFLPNMKDFLPSLTVRPHDAETQALEEAMNAELDRALDDEIVVEDEGKEDEEEPQPPDPEDTEEPESLTNSSNKILLESFLNNLPQCVNREMIDSAAVDFVMSLNTKYNRKKLVKMLFNVPRTRLDLLPFYARLVAILHPVMPDIASDLGQFLKQDFKYHVRKKDQINIESKIKVVRFIGELIKFRMYSKIEGLYCLKLLLHDFTYHHIEMCCNLLESCGRFLFRHPDSHQRTKIYLEQMMRKKCVTALDSRYVTMIENAYYYVNPPETAPCVKKERPIVHDFIRKILYQDLMKPNTDKVLRLMRKLDWEREELAAYAVKCLTMAFNVKYYNIRCLASLLAGLVTHQEFVGTQVVDGVMEDIRLGMEINQPKYNQRRVAMIKYLGELYNYRMVESGDVFKVLYSLIMFGVTMDHLVPSPLDPPDNLFRIRLVCVLLETCGQYFNSGISKKKLDYFFMFFQNYFWFKYSDPYWSSENVFPVGIEYMFRDTVLSLRPNMRLHTNYTESQKSVSDLQAEFKTQLGDVAGVSTTVADDESVELSTIMEAVAELDDEPEGGGEDGRRVEGEGQPRHGQDDEEEEGVTERAEADADGYAEADDRYADDDEGEAEDYSEVTSEIEEVSPLHSQSQGEEANVLSALPPGPSRVECPEDDDFLNAFDRMVSDNIQDRMRETVKPQQVDISVPLHVKSNTKKTYEQLQQAETEEKSTMNFVLMVRKGHKQQYKNLAVPLDSALALNLKNREEAERAEKERVKRLTLDINERLEEEDYQEMLAQAQRPIVMNLNRERRHKYQHPKGAPDADLIFGPKKVR